MSEVNYAEPEELEHQLYHHWQGLPLIQPVKGTFAVVLDALPHFGRQPFAIASVNGMDIGINPFLDTVYRIPKGKGEKPIPVGVVSKNYRLVDHDQVLRTVEEVLVQTGLLSEAFEVTAQWTLHGERAHFSIVFPSDERFAIQINNENDQTRFRIEIFNSVEGSCRLIAVAGWLRFVCSNGLILGRALFHLQRQHRQQLEVDQLARVVRESISSVDNDKSTFDHWAKQSIDPSAVVAFIDGELCSKWGLKAAVRVLHIVMHGWDVKLVGDVRNRKPSEVNTKKTSDVPGVDGPATNVFEVSQALAWIAGQRAEIGEDFEWRSHVSELMARLAAKCA